MAYVDHTFSIRDDVSGGTFIVHNGPPVKEIVLAVTLLALGTLGIVFGVIMSVYKVGGDSGHVRLLFTFGSFVYPVQFFELIGYNQEWLNFNLPPWISWRGIAFAILGTLLFMPGFYYTRIAYYAYKGYKGFSFSNIPAV